MGNNRFNFALMAVALVACSDKRAVDNFAVSPDQQHLVVLTSKTARLIDVNNGEEVARAENLNPIATFSPDGALLLTRTAGGTLLVIPTAGGTPVDLGPAIDIGTASPNHARIAFLRNKALCPVGATGFGWLCGDLMVAPAVGGEAIRVASGVRLGAQPDGTVNPTSGFDRYDFAGNDTLVFTNFESALLSVPADGSAPPERIAGPTGISPGNVPLTSIWCATSDGQVAYTTADGVELIAARGGTPTLLVSDPDASAVSRLTSSPYRVRNIACAFSPDGAYVVVTDFQRPSYVKLVPVPVCGSSAVTFPTPNNFWTAFNADGELLFWDQNGTLSIGSVSGDVRSIGVGINDLAALPVLSADHQWIAVSSPFHVPGCFNCVSLKIVSSTTGESWVLGDQHGAMPVWGFSFSPDSSSLLTIGAVRRTNNSSTDSGGDLSVVPITGGAAEMLEHNVDTAEWVDSQHIAFRRDQSGGINIRRVH